MKPSIGIGMGVDKVRLGTNSNQSPPEIPDGAIITLSGNPITTKNGNLILTINGFVPNNALVSPSGAYIKTLNNEFITL